MNILKTTELYTFSGAFMGCELYLIKAGLHKARQLSVAESGGCEYTTFKKTRSRKVAQSLVPSIVYTAIVTSRHH